MNKRILLYDFGLFILEEVFLLVLHFIIPENNQSILLTCVILLAILVCAVTTSIYIFRYMKSNRVTLMEVLAAFTLVVIATLIYLVIYNNNTFPLFTGLKGTVFLGITMTIGYHGLSYLSHYLLDRSKEFGFGYKAKEYLFFSVLFEKIAIITMIGTVIVIIVDIFT